MPFYSDALTNMTKLAASKQMESYGLVKYAVLKEYDPEHCVVKVGWYNANTDDYDSLTSGWLPLIVPFIGIGDDTGAGSGGAGGGGNPWGLVAPPNIGQPVIVVSQHGDFNNGLVLGGTYSEISPVPQVDGAFTQDGEFLIMHKHGSYLKFFNDKDINIYATANLNLHSDKDTNIGIKGQLVTNADGHITLKSGATITEAAKSQIVLDAPVVNVTHTLVVGNGATGSFEVNGFVVTVENGIVTNIV